MGTYDLGSPDDDYYGQGDWRCDPIDVTNETYRYWELTDNEVARFEQAKSIYDMALQNLTEQFDKLYNTGSKANPGYKPGPMEKFLMANYVGSLTAALNREGAFLRTLKMESGTRDDTVSPSE